MGFERHSSNFTAAVNSDRENDVMHTTMIADLVGENITAAPVLRAISSMLVVSPFQTSSKVGCIWL